MTLIASLPIDLTYDLALVRHYEETKFRLSQVNSRRIHCTLSLYIPAKNPANSPGYFCGKLKLRHMYVTVGTHRRLNHGT